MQGLEFPTTRVEIRLIAERCKKMHYEDHDYIDNDQFLIKLIFTMMSAQVNTEPTISRSIKLIVRSGSEGTRPREKVSGDNLAQNAIIL